MPFLRRKAVLPAAMLGLEDTEPLDVTVVENGGKEGIGRVGSFNINLVDFFFFTAGKQAHVIPA